MFGACADVGGRKGERSEYICVEREGEGRGVEIQTK